MQEKLDIIYKVCGLLENDIIEILKSKGGFINCTDEDHDAMYALLCVDGSCNEIPILGIEYKHGGINVYYDPWLINHGRELLSDEDIKTTGYLNENLSKYGDLLYCPTIMSIADCIEEYI